MTTTMERIHATYLVPVVVMEDAARALDASEALLRGGVDIMEITLRTAAGLDAIEAVAKGNPDVLVGAGTVLSLEQCKKAVDRGAKFIVSPGYDPEVVEWCLKEGMDALPGCVTPTEITAAMHAGIDVVKFFPAGVYGGVKAIKALSGPFGRMRFVPTGGVGPDNLAAFIVPAVFAVGGGWLCEKQAIGNGDWDAVTKACAASRQVVLAKRDF